MITLAVSDYCHNCPSFDPELETLYCVDDNGTNVHYVKCSRALECQQIRLHIERQFKEKHNADD